MSAREQILAEIAALPDENTSGLRSTSSTEARDMATSTVSVTWRTGPSSSSDRHIGCGSATFSVIIDAKMPTGSACSLILLP